MVGIRSAAQGRTLVHSRFALEVHHAVDAAQAGPGRSSTCELLAAVCGMQHTHKGAAMLGNVPNLPGWGSLLHSIATANDLLAQPPLTWAHTHLHP